MYSIVKDIGYVPECTVSDKSNREIIHILIFGGLTPLSTIFQLYHDNQY